MAYMEVYLFKNCNEIFGETITNDIKQNYFRFLDEVILFWKDFYGDYNKFLEIINSLHINFKFTFYISRIQTTFLDIKLIKQDNFILTDIFYKTTDSHQYLHFHSTHPRHIKRNIPYCLAFRIIKIVNNNELRQQRLSELKQILNDLKYP